MKYISVKYQNRLWAAYRLHSLEDDVMKVIGGVAASPFADDEIKTSAKKLGASFDAFLNEVMSGHATVSAERGRAFKEAIEALPPRAFGSGFRFWWLRHIADCVMADAGIDERHRFPETKDVNNFCLSADERDAVRRRVNEEADALVEADKVAHAAVPGIAPVQPSVVVLNEQQVSA